MALIDIPKRVEDYIAAHNRLTPPCFAVALDAVTGGNGVDYEKFDKHFLPSGGVNFVQQMALLEECFPGRVWPYSPTVVSLLSPTRVTEINNHVAERATVRVLTDVTSAALVISEPGSTSKTNHARAITPTKRPGTAIIWDSKSDPLMSIVGETGLKQTLIDCLDRPESHLFAIGFTVHLQDLLLE